MLLANVLGSTFGELGAVTTTAVPQVDLEKNTSLRFVCWYIQVNQGGLRCRGWGIKLSVPYILSGGLSVLKGEKRTLKTPSIVKGKFLFVFKHIFIKHLLCARHTIQL